MTAANPRKAARNRGKQWEREAGKDLGTTRTGPTGMDDADLKHDLLGVECKALAKLMLRGDHWKQAKDNAKGRIPVLALKELGTGVKLAVIEWDYFVSLHTDKENNNGE